VDVRFGSVVWVILVVIRRDETVLKRHRILGFDIARAFAMFGMVAVNFKVVMGADGKGPEWLVFAASLLNGRAAATFVVLAGIGISLMTNKARLASNVDQTGKHREILLKRALFLFVVGLLYTPIWPADILHFYGVYIAIAVMFLTVSTRTLVVITGTTTFLFLVFLFFFDYERGWNWETLQYAEFWTMGGMFRHIFFNGFHPVLPWLSFLTFGMVMGRSNFAESLIRRRWLVFGIFMTIIAETGSWLLIESLSTNAGALDRETISSVFGTAPMPPMPLYMFAGIGVACIVISLSVSLGEISSAKKILSPLISTGQIALTLYVAHVVIGMGILESLGRLDNQTLPFALSSAVVFCVLAVVFAHFWAARFDRGPLEAIMRRITG